MERLDAVNIYFKVRATRLFILAVVLFTIVFTGSAFAEKKDFGTLKMDTILAMRSGWKTGDYSQALKYGKELKALGEERGTDKYGREDYIYSLVLLAKVYKGMESYGEAEEHYLEAYSEAIKNRGQNHEKNSFELGELMRIYALQKKEKLMLSSLEEYLHLAKIHHLITPTSGYRTVANFYKDNNDFDKAEHYFKEYLSSALEYNKPQPHFFEYVAEFYAQFKKYDQAIEYYERSKDTIDKEKRPHNLVKISSRLSDIYRILGNKEKEREEIESALNILEKCKCKIGEEELKKKLANIERD